MNNKIILQLIKKDLDELQMLVDALMTDNESDPLYLEIAVNKAQALQSELKMLSANGKQFSVLKNTADAIVETKKEPLVNQEVKPVTEPVVLVSPAPIPAAVIPEPIKEPKTEPEYTAMVVAKEPVTIIPAQPIFTEAEKEKHAEPEPISISEATETSAETLATKTTINEVTHVSHKHTTEPKSAEPKHHEMHEHDHDKKILAETFTKEPSLNEKLAAAKPHEARIKAKPITNLRSAIGINDRFLFQRELFDNDPGKFDQTVQHLDASGGLSEAIEYLESNYQWNKTETSLKFIELIKRRFQN